jgi:hypothetical protein
MEFARWARDQWDRVLAGVAAVVGAALLIIGWVQTSQALYPGQQLPYIVSAGLGGIFLLGLSATAWLSADLRDEWRKLDRVEETFADMNSRLARLEELDRTDDGGSGTGPSTTLNGGGRSRPPVEEGSRA